MASPLRLRFVSWNIDGLCRDAVGARASAAVAALNALEPAPDAVLLQEVVASNQPIFQQYAKSRGMQIFTGEAAFPRGYFCALLVAPPFKVTEAAVVPFPGSVMGRHLIHVEARHPHVGDVVLMTSHLESLKPHAEQRKKQLAIVLGELQGGARAISGAAPTPRFAFFAGDTNLRDPEVGKLPDGAADAWVAAGKPAEAQYTWDLLKNKNAIMPDGGTPRMRFDRGYYWTPPDAQEHWRIAGVSLVGTESSRLPGASRPLWPSDHFGLCCDFEYTGPAAAGAGAAGDPSAIAASAGSAASSSAAPAPSLPSLAAVSSSSDTGAGSSSAGSAMPPGAAAAAAVGGAGSAAAVWSASSAAASASSASAARPPVSVSAAGAAAIARAAAAKRAAEAAAAGAAALPASSAAAAATVASGPLSAPVARAASTEVRADSTAASAASSKPQVGQSEQEPDIVIIDD